MTTYFSAGAKEYGGYNFAYPSGHAAESDGYSRHGWKYGKEIVLFTAPSVLVDHHGDQEEQAIFWGADARQLVYVQQDYEDYGYRQRNTRFCVGEDRQGRPIFCTDSLDDIIGWLQMNYQKYEQQLSCYGVQPSAEREHRSGKHRR